MKKKKRLLCCGGMLCRDRWPTGNWQYLLLNTLGEGHNCSTHHLIYLTIVKRQQRWENHDSIANSKLLVARPRCSKHSGAPPPRKRLRKHELCASRPNQALFSICILLRKFTSDGTRNTHVVLYSGSHASFVRMLMRIRSLRDHQSLWTANY